MISIRYAWSSRCFWNAPFNNSIGCCCFFLISWLFHHYLFDVSRTFRKAFSLSVNIPVHAFIFLSCLWITLPGPHHFTKRGGLMFNPATFYWSTCICMLGVLIVPLSTNFLFDFVPTVRYCVFFIYLLCFSLDTFDGAITLFWCSQPQILFSFLYL